MGCILIIFVIIAWHLRLKQYYPESDSSPSEGVPGDVSPPQVLLDNNGL